ncbi:ADP/ATP-dependent (S)-NAD(P)H-hydrate dehydratase [uncultured Gardnerella sp.]|uniref:ADP-dependent NAD(P)H-hydrate dehydratase n=1 Tax=uncultured Gardnerella sp. TaxID=293424 RepID=UPI00344C4C2B
MLTTSAASKSNIGMVHYAGALRAQNLVLQASPEIVVSQKLQGKVNAITLGSGIPDSKHCKDNETKEQREYISEILKLYSINKKDENKTNTNNLENVLQQDTPPICVDAGALDLLPEKVSSKVILTPHYSELSSLLKRYEIYANAQLIATNPIDYAILAANLTNATVLLKGSNTIVASPENLDLPIYISNYGPSWLATAGSGDVLAGILGALLAQNYSNPSDYSKQENSKKEDKLNYALIASSAATIHSFASILASHKTQNYNYNNEIKKILNTKEDLIIEHPIVAKDIIEALEQAIGLIMKL